MENIKVKQLEPLFPAVEHTDFRELLNWTTQEYGEDDCYIIKHKSGMTRKNGKLTPEVEYEHVSYRKLKEDVDGFGQGLYRRGFRDQRVAVMAENCQEWMLVYLTVPCGLGKTVPLDKGIPYEEALTSVNKARADVLVFDKKHQNIAERLLEEAPTLKQLISTQEIDGYDSVWDIVREGREAIARGENDYQNLPFDPNDTALILFTSGTSGLAKAVLLSQRNVLANVYAMQRTQDIRHGDINMAFLPYHHTFGCDTQVMMYACGVTTVFCDGLRYIQKNMVEYHVSIFIGVPLLIESIYKKIMHEAERQGQKKKLLRGMKIAAALNKAHIDVRRKMFRSVIDQLGGALRFTFSGAAALDPGVVRAFEAMGIHVVQGYGMTEASPVLVTESALERRPGSIGKALCGIDVELLNPNVEGIGEIIARGPNVMSGYYEDPEATAETIVDGWLHTGDLARMDEDGFLYIAGRAKNVIVLKNGKNVYPEEIETLIADFPYVKENIIYGEPKHAGDDRDLALCAKIVYDPEYMENVCHVKTPEEISGVIWKDIEQLNERMPVYKRITRLVTQEREMEKTTTGKVKRYREGAVKK